MSWGLGRWPPRVGLWQGRGEWAGTAGTPIPPVDCTLFVGRAAGRSERQRVLGRREARDRPRPEQRQGVVAAGTRRPARCYRDRRAVALAQGRGGRRVDPRPDRPSAAPPRSRCPHRHGARGRRRDRTGAVRGVPPAAAVGARIGRDSRRGPSSGSSSVGWSRGRGVRSGERVGEGATAGRLGQGEGNGHQGRHSRHPFPRRLHALRRPRGRALD